MSDCGHTDKEHDETARIEAELVMSGNFAPLFARMEEEQIAVNLQALFVEIFVRSGDDETFEHNIEEIHDRINQVLLHGDDEPEIREALVEARNELIKANEGAEFMEEAEDELRIMLEKQGVAEKTAPVEEQYGFYL